MKKDSFLKLVEIQTKVASVLPLFVGIVFTLYRYQRFNPLVIGVFFVSLICLDMATTAINNLMDYKKARLKEGYNYEVHNAIVHYQLSVGQVKSIIGILLALSVITGLFLVFLTDVIVLVIGAIAFATGILYSFGPLPISRTPFGELFSGLFMGAFIFFVTVYIQIYDMGFFIIRYADDRLFFNLHILEFVIIGLVSIPMILGIANIMLANNTCDLEDDIINNRHTLPYYIGKSKALVLFQILTYGAYIWIILGVLTKILPVTALLVLLTYLPVKKHVDAFCKVQAKEKTFVFAVQNFVLISSTYMVSIFVGVIIQHLLD